MECDKWKGLKRLDKTTTVSSENPRSEGAVIGSWLEHVQSGRHSLAVKYLVTSCLPGRPLPASPNFIAMVIYST
jgi:hypothetical protein